MPRDPCMQAQTRSLSIRARRRKEKADLADDPGKTRCAARRLFDLFPAEFAEVTLGLVTIAAISWPSQSVSMQLNIIDHR